MLLKNEQIYTSAQLLNQFFNVNCDCKLPIKINFFLQKNIKLMSALAMEIDQARMDIAKQNGVLNEAGDAYIIPEDKQAQVNQALDELFNLTQEVSLHIFKLEDFENVELTYQQMNAIMFMIEE